MCCQRVQLGSHDDIVKSDTEGQRTIGSPNEALAASTNRCPVLKVDENLVSLFEGKEMFNNKRDLSGLCIKIRLLSV